VSVSRYQLRNWGALLKLSSASVRAANSIVDVGYSIAQKKARNNAIKAQLSGKSYEINAKYILIKNAQWYQNCEYTQIVNGVFVQVYES
jgi:hypothetical protein